ncbi:MAG: hypothetical protein IPM29_05400 [Planctomycetes bacterium]|nr:hypothetical protein [Planctomycetota bacterium]
MSLALLAALPVGQLAAQDSADCMGCHGEADLTIERDGREFSIYVDADKLAASAHGASDCIDCHVDLQGVDSFPHEADLQPARCDGCHDDSFDSIAAYLRSAHGLAVEAGNPNGARCSDCHGGHEILSASVRQSRTHPANIETSCIACHRAGQPPARPAPGETAAAGPPYHDQIHASLADKGLTVTPVCTSCHSAHGALPHDQPDSSISRENVNATCMKCHADPAAPHGTTFDPSLWADPATAPLCVDCHAPHQPRVATYGTNMSDGECLACHSVRSIVDGRRPTLFVDSEQTSHSVHGRHRIACAQCHSEARPAVDDRSCRTVTRKVDCSGCHSDYVADYEAGVHGRLRATGDQDPPTCVDCHGTHGIVESHLPDGPDVPEALRDLVRTSPTGRRNVPELCARCHAQGKVAAIRLGHTQRDVVQEYRDSVHGKGLLESGLVTSANCIDCHSPHRILPPEDPQSTVSHERIVHTCGRCHDGIEERFRYSIHAPGGNPDYVASEGGPELPGCNDCHSSHSVVRTDLPDFKRSMIEQCGGCHEHIAETYFQTYHGKVSALGSEVAAKCADCHGSHGIRAPNDPLSSLNQSNIVDTCSKCHDGAHQSFTQFIAHATHDDPERYPALYWTFFAMTWLLVGVFGFFGMHVVAWLPRSVALRAEMKRIRAEHASAKRRREFQRFTPLQSALHRMVIVSFLGLALTGMTLKFAQASWAKATMHLLGGPDAAGWVHRLCAFITFSYMGIHLVDLARRFLRSGESAQQFFLGPNSMVPNLKDLKDLIGTLRWFLGLGPRPRYGKWTYWEKFDYFAVFWGVIVIGMSGLVLWFPITATAVLPGWAINVATIIHSEEALLATGFIFTVHFFNTHLRPEKFPMDDVVFTGRMGVEELKADKPQLYDDLVASGKLEDYLVTASTPGARRRARIFGTIALTIGITVLVLLVHGLVTVGI